MTDDEKAAEEWIARNETNDRDGDIREYHLVKAFTAGIAHEREKHRWRDCTKELPMKDGTYLCSMFEGDTGSPLHYNTQHKGWNLGFCGERVHELFPRYWHPLPDAPEWTKGEE